jgi:hypothetical protein
MKDVIDLIVDMPRRGVYDEMFSGGEYLEVIDERIKILK